MNTPGNDDWMPDFEDPEKPQRLDSFCPSDATACCASWCFLGTLQLSLTAANFFFQVCVDQDWGKALDRSFFQLAALFAVWLTCKITSIRHNA